VDLAELGLAGGDQGALVELGAEIVGVGIGHDLAGIVAGAEALADQVVETESVRTDSVSTT